MKKLILMLSVSLFLLLAWMAARPVFAGQASRSVLDAKREAENRGYVLRTNNVVEFRVRVGKATAPER